MPAKFAVYVSDSCDPGGNGEGERLLSAPEGVAVNTDGAGVAAFDVALTGQPASAGQFVTATATTAGGETSELSTCQPVAAATAPPSPNADLGVQLTPTPPDPQPGKPLTLRGTVANRGPRSSPDTVLEFDLPGSARLEGATQGCAAGAGGAVSCPIGTLASGESASRDVTVTFEREGEVTAGVTAQGSAPDPTSGDRSQSRTLAVKLPPPVTRRSFNASVTSGDVEARCRGERRFREIEGDTNLPLGCLLDTREGRVAVTTTAGGGRTQTAVFFAGLFRTGQSRGRKPITEVQLTGRVQRCGRAGRAVAQTSRRRRGRRLWGRGRGRFRTRGRRGSASVRGTTWFVEDRCDGSTYFKVRVGRVAVRDFARRATIILRRGRSYTATGRRRP